MAVTFCLLLLFTVVATLPVKKTFDQRQDGGLNIHAQLENVVIVLVPTSGVSLVDLAAKSRPNTNSLNLLGKTSQENFDKSPTLTLLESKSSVESPVLVLKTKSSADSLPGGSTELPLFSPATARQSENKIFPASTPGLLNKDFSTIKITPSENVVKASFTEELNVSKSKHGEKLSALNLKTSVSETKELPSVAMLTPESVSKQEISAMSPLSALVDQPLGDSGSVPQKQVTKESCSEHVETAQLFDLAREKVTENSGEPVSLEKEKVPTKEAALLVKPILSENTVPIQPTLNEDATISESKNEDKKTVAAESTSIALKKDITREKNNK